MEKQSGQQHLILSVDNSYDGRDEGGITFGRIAAFIKIAALRTLIYCLIAFIIGSLVVMVIDLTRARDTFTHTSIILVYPGASLGQLPTGGGFFDPQMIIDVSVLSQAVERAHLGHIIENPDVLRPYFSVQSVNPQEYYDLLARIARNPEDAEALELLHTTNFFPTRFNIVFTEPTNYSLNRTQALSLVNAVRDVFSNEFTNRFFSPTTHSMLPFTPNLNERSFIMHYLQFSRDLAPIENYLTTLSHNHSSFRAPSSRLSFADLLTRLDRINEALTSYRTFVLMHAVTDNINFELAMLNNLRQSLNAEISNLQTRIDGYTRDIADATPETFFTEDGIPVGERGNAAIHTQLLVARTLLNAQYANAHRSLEATNQIYQAFSAANGAMTDDDRDDAENRLNSIHQSLNDLMTDINDALYELHTVHLSGNGVRTVAPAAFVQIRERNMMLYITILVVMVLAGLIVACVVTQAKRVRLAKERDRVTK